MSSKNKGKKGKKGKFRSIILGMSSSMYPKTSAKTATTQANNNQGIDDSRSLDTSVSSAVNSGNSSVDARLKSEDTSFGANPDVLNIVVGNASSDEHIQTNNNQRIADSTMLGTPVSSAFNSHRDSPVDGSLKSEDDIGEDAFSSINGCKRSEDAFFENDSTADLRKSEDHKTDATPSKKTIIQKFYDFIKSICQATVALFKRAYLAISSLFSKSMFYRNTAQTTTQSDADAKKQDEEQNLSSSLCNGLSQIKKMIFSNNPLIRRSVKPSNQA